MTQRFEEEKPEVIADLAIYMNMIPTPAIIYDSKSYSRVFSNTAGSILPEDFDIRPYLPNEEESNVQTRPLIISLQDIDGTSHQYQYSLERVPGKDQLMLTLSDITDQSVQKRVLETVVNQSNDNFVVVAPFGDWQILYSSNEDYIDQNPGNNTIMSKIEDMISRIPPVPDNLQLIEDLQNINLSSTAELLTKKGILNYQIPQMVDGKQTWVNIRMVPIMNEYYQDQLDYIGFTINDITAFKQHDETGEFHAVLGEEFSKDDIIETVSYAYTRLKSLFDMLAHDLRTPLTSVQLAAQKVKRPETVYDSLTERSLSSIQYHINMMSTMLMNVDLLISKGEYFANPMYRSVLKLGEHIAGTFANHKEVQVKVLELDSDPNATFDQNIMKHIAMNLVSNAIKYNRNNGPIHVNIWRGDKNSDDELVMEVTDQGIGIPKEDLSSIFEFRKRASNSGNVKGTGIGLSVVMKLVEAHGGKIEVESEVDKGTRFTVRILKGQN